MTDPCDDTLSNDDLHEQIRLLKDHFTRPIDADKHPAREAAIRFGLEDQQDLNQLLPVGTNSLESALWKTEFAVTRLQIQLERRNFLDAGLATTVADPGTDLARDILKIRECIVRLHRVLEADLQARKACDPSWGSEMPTLRNPFGVSMLESQKLDGYQMLIVFLLKRLAIKGYMRYRGACQEEIDSNPFVVNGRTKRFKTRAWRRVMDIKEFVVESAPKETSFEMWKSLLSGNHIDKATNQLLLCKDPEFGDLKPDRHQHSFTNGLQNTLTQEFWSYDDPEFPTTSIVSCKYHSDAHQDVAKIGSNRHWDPVDPDLPLGPLDWQDIPTPLFHSIFEFQLELKQDAEAIKSIVRWIQTLLGRFLFEVNERDSWQVIPFFIGRAGTGKSLILDTIKDFFSDEDIATVANNSQKGFGLETVQDKLGWRCMEVKKDFSLDQAQLQSMITGEEVSIQRKNREALSVVWKAPGLLAGNEVANWSDNSGSISRRMILIKFNRKVAQSDPTLKTKIKAERAALMHKCSRAQADSVEKYGGRDLWAKRSPTSDKTILPMFQHELRQMLTRETHVIAAFLGAEDLIKLLDGQYRTLGMPMKAFEDACKKFSQDKGYGQLKWSKDKYETVFEDNDIEEVVLSKEIIAKRFGGRITQDGVEYNDSCKWLYGVTLKRVWDEISRTKA